MSVEILQMLSKQFGMFARVSYCFSFVDQDLLIKIEVIVRQLLPQLQPARADAILVNRSATGPAYTTLSVTSILPRVALEYAHVASCVASTMACATSRSKPGKLTLNRAWRK